MGELPEEPHRSGVFFGDEFQVQNNPNGLNEQSGIDNTAGSLFTAPGGASWMPTSPWPTGEGRAERAGDWFGDITNGDMMGEKMGLRGRRDSLIRCAGDLGLALCAVNRMVLSMTMRRASRFDSPFSVGSLICAMCRAG